MFSDSLCVHTHLQYGVNFVLDRTWKPSPADFKQWSERKAAGTLSEYKPSYVPFICLVNEVTCNFLEVLLWEQTGGAYLIQKSNIDNKFYNRYKIRGLREFTEEFEVENYPFDFQDLSIIISAETANIDQQRLVPHHTCPAYFEMNKTWSSVTDWTIKGLYCREFVVDTNHHINGEKSSQEFLESWTCFTVRSPFLY